MKDIKDILKSHGFRFNHSLGQNFITDQYLLDSIVEGSGVGSDDTVIEIGAGAGTLTRSLCARAKRVIAFEIDNNLSPILKESLEGLGNVEVIFADILKMSDQQIMDIAGGSFKVVANLPYYITSPLIMRFVESTLPVVSLSVMVQKEVADRLVASPNTSDYGAITLAVQLEGEASITLNVDKYNFYPVPKVDSAVVRIDMRREKYMSLDKKSIRKLIKCGFAMRRKTLVNNLIATYHLTREQAVNLLISLGFDERIRGEALSLEDYISLQSMLQSSNLTA